MRILVGGGAGYVGSALVPVLLDYGYEVDVIDLCWFGNNVGPWVKQKDLMECTEKDFEGYDQFVFLGGVSNDPMAEFSPSKNFVYNAALPGYLAYVAKRAGVKRFVYASSCSVYGYTVNELYDEQAPTVCHFPYGISKLQGERGVMAQQDDKMSVIALRKGTVSGYSPRMRLDLIVNTMFKCAVFDGKIIIHNPSLWRPILDIRDAVSAYCRAIQADLSLSGVFNVLSGNYTVGQVGDVVRKEVQELSGQSVAMEIGNRHDMRNYKVTGEKAKVVLGYEPQYALKDIVRHLWDNIGMFSDHATDRYYNIKVFRSLP